jgi:hypothetical protein
MNRVWTFVIGKPLGDEELAQLTQAGRTFVEHWTAHEKQLRGAFDVLGRRIVVVKVNEDLNQASGCSIDKLTRFMKMTESRFGVELLNRMNVAYREGDSIAVANANDVRGMIEAGRLKADTVVFNTAAANEDELSGWEKPLKDTWLSRYLQTA